MFFFYFEGNDDDLAQGIRGLNITSGSRTYRIPSPTRPTISQNSFQPHPSISSRSATPDVTPLDPTDANEKGFYISFGNDAPKKPKPTLRMKRTSPKKVSALFLLQMCIFNILFYLIIFLSLFLSFSLIYILFISNKILQYIVQYIVFLQKKTIDYVFRNKVYHPTSSTRILQCGQNRLLLAR